MDQKILHSWPQHDLVDIHIRWLFDGEGYGPGDGSRRDRLLVEVHHEIAGLLLEYRQRCRNTMETLDRIGC